MSVSVKQINFQLILGPYCQNLKMKVVQEYQYYQKNYQVAVVGEEILLLLFVGSCLSLNLFSQFLIAKSSPGGPGACFIRWLAKTFFPASSSLSREPTIEFSESKVKISSKTSSRGFCHLEIFLLIGSSFCRKLALLILSFVT